MAIIIKSQLLEKLKSLPYFEIVTPVVGMVGIVLLGYLSTPFEKARLKLADSPTGAQQFLDSAMAAAAGGDYVLAKQLFETGADAGVDKVVLGAQSEVVEAVFPEVIMEKRLLEIEAVLETQPTYVDGLIEKTLLLYQLKLDEQARETLDLLVKLDPNNVRVLELESILKDN